MKNLTRLQLFAVSVLFAVLPVLCPVLSWGDGPPPAAPPAAAEFTDRLIVKYRDPALARAARLEAGRVRELSASAGVALAHVRPMSGSGQVFRLPKRMSLEDAKAIAAQLSADPRVEYAAPDRRMHRTTLPNDPRYADQWHYKSPDAPDNEVAGINLPLAWDITTGSDGVVVGVIDTGIVDHADLQGRVLPGYNFISEPDTAGNGVGRSADASDLGDWVSSEESSDPSSILYGCPVEPSSWHGTHVAGTIAASSNNGSGVAGINWSAKILPVRVLGKCGGYTSDIIDGIRWAAGLPVPNAPLNSTPARVINMSLGGQWSCAGAPEQSAINDAVAAGATIVAAAGNSSANAAYFTPAGCNGVIAVAALNRKGGLAYYSNFGQIVKVAAPGGEQLSRGDPNGVLSTFNSGTASPVPSPDGDTYHYYQGTSQATPHVTGTISLMLSLHPDLTPPRIVQLLQATARPFPTGTGSTGGDCTVLTCGTGIVDAFQAVQAVASNAPVISASPLILSFEAHPGGQNPPSRAVTIANPGGGTLHWSASGSAPWLRVSPSSGSNGGTVTVSVDTSSFTGFGPFSGTVTIAAAGAVKPSVAIPVAVTNKLTLHAPMPTAVSDHAMAAVNGKIYVIGGFTAKGKNLLQIYDTAAETWTTGAAKPTPSANTNAAVIGGKIYVPGGIGISSNAVLDTLEIYDPAENTWSSGANLPQPLEGSGVEAINGRLYVAGGQDGSHGYAVAYVYDPATDEWSSLAPMNDYRSFFGTGVIDGKLYVSGGYRFNGGSNGDIIGSSEVYDPAANVWSPVGRLNAARIDHGSSVTAGMLYAFGGKPDLIDYLDSIEVYDPAQQGWSATSFYLNKARASMKSVAVNRKIYVIGGYDGQNVSNVNESLDLGQAQAVILSWGDQADITYGTLLGPMQLSAVANVPGRFVYNPPAGTVLNAGSGQTLSVTFIPTDTGYASVTKTVAINVLKATAAVTLGLAAVYDGTPKSATAATDPPGLAVAFTYNGDPTPPTSAGSYAVVATVDDPNYTGTAGGTFVVSKGIATITLGGLSATYDGTPKAATAATTPTGLGVIIIYNGSQTPPTAAGSYSVIATVNDPNYSGMASGTLAIAKGTATVTLGGLSAVYDGTPKPATATTNPAGVAVTFTYNGSPTLPTAAGSYAVVATIGDPNYSGMTSGTLVIAKVNTTVTLGNLSSVYDGAPKAATATTSPAGLSVVLTYNGSTTRPVSAGSSAVVATVNDPNYSGTATGTLVIAKATPVITWFNPADIAYGTPLGGTQLSAASPAPGTFAYTPAAGTVLGAGASRTLTAFFTPTDAANYATASASVTINVQKGAAAVTLGGLSAAYDGTQKSATATTTPKGLSVAFTYNGSATPPTAAGNYAVVATVNDSNYGGTATGTLAIAKGNATVTLGSLSAVYDGTPKPPTATTNPPGVNVTFTYNGSATPPAAAGRYTVVATVNDSNYSGTANGTLVIAKGSVTITLGGLSAPYDGTPKPATATTNPGGAAITVTYNGSATPPTAAGSYAVVATVSDSNYSGTASGTLVIAKGTAAVTLGGLSAIYDGTPKTATATVNPGGAAIKVTYNGSATPPTAAGSYMVIATVSDPNYSGSAGGTLVIAKGSAAVTLDGLSATCDGRPKSATALTSPAGLSVTITYNGRANPPTSAGNYSVVATVGDSNYSGSASGTLVIAKGSAAVTLGGLSVTYDGTAKPATAATSPAGLSVAFTYNGSATPPTAAGGYTVVGTVNDTNYGGTASGALVIAKASLTVTADAKSKVVGAADPALTYTYTSLAAGDAPSVFSGKLVRAAGEAAGTYPVGIGTLSAGPNYAVNFVGALLAIIPQSYTVAFVSGGHGALTGSVSQTVISGGATFPVTAVPATGYHFVNWTGSGGFATTTANPLIVTNVTANGSVTANFAINTYTVTPASGDNGAMRPNAVQTVNYGATASFTITPASGYYMPSISGCGGSMSGATYTTGPVTADCTVTAIFAAQPIRYTWNSVPSPVAVGYTATKKSLTVAVSATGPAATAPIAATTTASWIGITGDGTTVRLKKGKGSGKVTISVSENTSSIPRSGTIVLNGQPMTVTQAGAPCTIKTVTATPRSFTADGATVITVQVAMPDGCGWSVLPLASGAAWLTVGDPPSSGSGSFGISAAPNHGSEVKGKHVKAKTRKAVLTVRSAAGGKKSVAVSQSGD